jgi:hypothetical protein
MEGVAIISVEKSAAPSNEVFIILPVYEGIPGLTPGNQRGSPKRMCGPGEGRIVLMGGYLTRNSYAGAYI